jgi:hypothetical protein
MFASPIATHDRKQGAAIPVGVLLGLLLFCGIAVAGSEERKGTAGATELLIPTGARGSALGGTVVGDVEGVEALYWNPAGLALAEGTEALFTHTEYFAAMKLNYAAVGAHWGGFGSAAFSAKVLSIGDVIETTEDSPEGTGRVFSPTFAVIGATYSRRFTDRVAFGATLNYIEEKVLDAAARGVAFDFGVEYLFGWRGVRFGMVMKNFGPSMEFGGSSFQLSFQRPDADPTSTSRTFVTASSSFDMPSYFVIGGTGNLYEKDNQRLAVKAAFQNNNFVGDNLWGGVEWTYREMLALRASYFGSFTGTTDPTTGATSGGSRSGDDLYEGFALGAGMQLTSGGSRIGADIAWRPVRNYFSDVVEFGLKVRF